MANIKFVISYVCEPCVLLDCVNVNVEMTNRKEGRQREREKTSVHWREIVIK